jgi:hypothetical protein
VPIDIQNKIIASHSTINLHRPTVVVVVFEIHLDGKLSSLSLLKNHFPFLFSSASHLAQGEGLSSGFLYLRLARLLARLSQDDISRRCKFSAPTKNFIMRSLALLHEHTKPTLEKPLPDEFFIAESSGLHV